MSRFLDQHGDLSCIESTLGSTARDALDEKKPPIDRRKHRLGLSAGNEQQPFCATDHAIEQPDTTPSFEASSSVDERREPLSEREERQGDADRMRHALDVAMGVWSAFFLLDVLVVTLLGVGKVLFFALMRLLVLAVMLAGRFSVRGPSLSLRMRAAVDFAVYTSAAAAISVMCVPFWGFASPYACGICLVLVHRTLMSNESWKRGVLDEWHSSRRLSGRDGLCDPCRSIDRPSTTPCSFACAFWHQSVLRIRDRGARNCWRSHGLVTETRRFGGTAAWSLQAQTTNWRRFLRRSVACASHRFEARRGSQDSTA